MQNLNYLGFFSISVILTAVFTVVLIKLGDKFNVFDKPAPERKTDYRRVTLLGGMAVFIGFFVTIFLAISKLTATQLALHHWFGFFIGAIFLMIGGYLDDKYDLRPKQQIVWPILAALSVIIGGVQIEKITNPFGGYLMLDSIKLHFFNIGSLSFDFMLLSGILIFVWLLGMMYTTKLLDGIDGLVTSITGIGALIIFLFTISTKYYQPDIALASAIFAGACLGFLFFNWNPAKIYLGEGGSLLMGYILGVLAIISGGKIAVAMLIMGLPILDVVWTIIRRIKAGKNPFKFADRQHLHFRILDLGLSQTVTVLIYCAFALIFGLCAVFLQSLGKLFALILLVLIMIFIVAGFNYIDKRRMNKQL